MKTLVIFDFDDTLFKSDACVIVHNAAGQSKYLTTHEYAKYVPNPGETFDYSEFHTYPKNPRPIDVTIKQLKLAVRKHGVENVVVLTARGNGKPIEQVLDDFSLPSIYIAALDSSDPQMKGKFAASTVSEENYQQVIVFEDNLRNIHAIRSSLMNILDPSNIIAYHVFSVNDSATLIPV